MSIFATSCSLCLMGSEHIGRVARMNSFHCISDNLSPVIPATPSIRNYRRPNISKSGLYLSSPPMWSDNYSMLVARTSLYVDSMNVKIGSCATGILKRCSSEHSSSSPELHSLVSPTCMYLINSVDTFHSS